MKTIILNILLLSVLFSSEHLNFGKFVDDNSIYREKNIKELTSKFLGVKYVSNTLSNYDINESQEKLIINFDALDCFTFIDTIEALKDSSNKDNFVSNLVDVRYKKGQISYQNRNHFFSDWLDSNKINDVTCRLGKCKKKIKFLNHSEKYLKNIQTVQREVSYIHIKDIDTSLLLDGDYIGIYTNNDALDVTHTGIIIIKKDGIYLRHASSLKKEIIDSNLKEYTKDKLGIIVYRSIN